MYEFFLEFCICVCVQLSVRDFSDVSPSVQFVVSTLIAVAVLALLVFVVSQFWYKGPWVPRFYSKNFSFWSIMRARPRDPDFNVKEYLAEHPRDKVKPWGRAIISIDLNKLFCCKRGNPKNEVAAA